MFVSKENGQLAERQATEHFDRLFETLQERKSDMLKSIEQSRNRRMGQLKSQVGVWAFLLVLDLYLLLIISYFFLFVLIFYIYFLLIVLQFTFLEFYIFMYVFSFILALLKKKIYINKILYY